MRKPDELVCLSEFIELVGNFKNIFLQTILSQWQQSFNSRYSFLIVMQTRSLARTQITCYNHTMSKYLLTLPLVPSDRLPQVWAELLLTVGILWTLPGVPGWCLRAQAVHRPRHLRLALPPLPTRPWGQRRAPRKNRRHRRQSTWPLAAFSSPTTRETSAAWWTSTSPGPSAATWMERANGGLRNKAQVCYRNKDVFFFSLDSLSDQCKVIMHMYWTFL